MSYRTYWNDAYSVGNGRIDEQHRRLLGISGIAFEVLGAPVVSPRDFHALLNDFADAQREHFATEEEVLARNGDPGLAAHIAEHDVFRAKLTDILSQAERGHEDPKAFLRLIAECIGVLFMRTDMRSRHYFSDR
jgi:hemerythrin